MTMSMSEQPNAEQIAYWNEQAGASWVAAQAVVDQQIGPLGRLAMDRAAVAPGERVLDVGTGCGDTALELGRRVGPAGNVLGADISRLMLERARERARAAALTHVRFEEADAQTHAFAPASFDLVYSRFGVMFFVDPTAAFANLRAGLRPGGRVAFVCWRALVENPWMLVPLQAAFAHIAPPAPPPPDAPGPFAFADAERVRRILTGAGLADVRIEPLDETLTIGGGGDLDRAVEFLLRIGPLGRLLREAAPGAGEAVAGAVREAMRPYHGSEGVRMPSAAWIVSARRS